MSSKDSEVEMNDSIINDDDVNQNKNQEQNLDENPDDNQDEIIEYTSSEMLAHIQPYDSTVEIVGYVDNIESLRTVGEKQYLLFKFFLNNNQGDRIQIIAWNKEAQRTESLIKTNAIIHLDGAYCRPNANASFNKGTVNFELVIQSNTEVNILQMRDVVAEIDESEVPLIKLSELNNQTQRIRVRGYIKTNFRIVRHTSKANADYTVGAITDGDFKLEVRMPNEKKDLHFEKGDHVEAVGYLRVNANPIHFFVPEDNSIAIIDDLVMSNSLLRKGVKAVQKRKATGDHMAIKLKN